MCGWFKLRGGVWLWDEFINGSLGRCRSLWESHFWSGEGFSGLELVTKPLAHNYGFLLSYGYSGDANKHKT